MHRRTRQALIAIPVVIAVGAAIGWAGSHGSVGLFGRFGWSTGEANPIAQFYSIGAGGKGIIPNRDDDTFGVGYYYLNASDGFDDFFGLVPALGVTAEQGIELWYRIVVTPWWSVTPDLQILIDPGGSDDNDTAVVFGLRSLMKF